MWLYRRIKKRRNEKKNAYMSNDIITVYGQRYIYAARTYTKTLSSLNWKDMRKGLNALWTINTRERNKEERKKRTNERMNNIRSILRNETRYSSHISNNPWEYFWANCVYSCLSVWRMFYCCCLSCVIFVRSTSTIKSHFVVYLVFFSLFFFRYCLAVGEQVHINVKRI